MPYLPTAQSWLHQSTILLQARPTTTRITTKYTLEPATSRKKTPNPTNTTDTTNTTTPPNPSDPPNPPPPKAHLILKTYDPASGACLKYRTDKAAEVGRLIAALGRCGRVMASLPERAEEAQAQAQTEKAVGSGAGTGRSTPVAEAKGVAGEKEKGKGVGGKKKKGKK